MLDWSWSLLLLGEGCDSFAGFRLLAFSLRRFELLDPLFTLHDPMAVATSYDIRKRGYQRTRHQNLPERELVDEHHNGRKTHKDGHKDDVPTQAFQGRVFHGSDMLLT